jgi:hypothetical protein
MNYDRELNKGMKVFSQLYVGLKSQYEDKVDLGFATPFENNSAFRKRKVTIDNWAGQFTYETNADGTYKRDSRGNYIRKEIEPRHKIVDNQPRSGFRITDDVKRVYWGGGNVVWRVEDPAGFELEIQSQNLMAIIQTAGIGEGGVIPGSCLWGRDGKDNILLHEKSDEYKNAILAAETLKSPKKAAASDRIVGSTYLLQDGSEAVYLGKFFVVREAIVDESCFKTKAKIGTHSVIGTSKKRKLGDVEIFDVVRIGSSYGRPARLYKKAPLVRMIGEPKTLTQDEAQTAVEESSQLSFASSSIDGRIAHISNKKFTQCQYVMKPMRKRIFDDRYSKILSPGVNMYFTGDKERSAGNLGLFYGGWGSDATIIALKVNDGYYSEFVEISSVGGEVFHIMTPIVTDSQDVRLIDVDRRAMYYNSYYHAFHYDQNKIDVNSDHVECIEIPTYRTKEEVAAWFKDQFDTGHLFEVRAEPVEE